MKTEIDEVPQTIGKYGWKFDKAADNNRFLTTSIEVCPSSRNVGQDHRCRRPHGDQGAAMTYKKSISSSLALTVLFIILKITHRVEWDWLWGLSPLWMGAAAVVSFVVFLLLLAAYITTLRILLNLDLGHDRS